MKCELTSRERLLWALSCKEPDRVPIWMLYPRQPVEYYADVYHSPSYAEVIPYVWQKTDWFDRRSIPAPPLFSTAAVETSEVVKQDDRRTVVRSVLHTPMGDLYSTTWRDHVSAGWTVTEFYCKDVTDLERVLSIPYEPAQPDLTEFRQAAAALGDDGLMMVNLGLPIEVAYDLLGPENFAIYSLTERDFLVRFTQVIFEREYTFLKQALEAGAGPVFFVVGTEFVAPPMCAPSTFDVLIAPFAVPIFDLIHSYGGWVIVHHHGRINALLERIAEVGANAIHPIEEPPVGDCTLAEAKRRVGDRVCLIGSVQYDDFQRLTPDEMEALVKRQIRDAAPGGGMILAPTAGPYAHQLTERQKENTIRFIEAGWRWGRYPLQLDE